MMIIITIMIIMIIMMTMMMIIIIIIIIIIIKITIIIIPYLLLSPNMKSWLRRADGRNRGCRHCAAGGMIQHMARGPELVHVRQILAKGQIQESEKVSSPPRLSGTWP